jgi:ABC-type sulfate transport system permease component
MPKSSFLMRRLRAILLTDYIGAILIALLASQAIIVFFAALVQQISYYTHFAEHSLTGPAYRSSHWEPVLTSLVRIVLYLLTAYLLVRWLYGSGPYGSASANNLQSPTKGTSQP